MRASEARAATLSQLVRSEGTGVVLGGGDEEFAQVLGPDGSVVAGSLVADPLVSGAETAETTLERKVDLPEEPGVSARSLAVPWMTTCCCRRRPGRPRRGARRFPGPAPDRRAHRAHPRFGAAYLLAGAALRPVEAMRARAADISAETAAQRLPLPTPVTRSSASARR